MWVAELAGVPSSLAASRMTAAITSNYIANDLQVHNIAATAIIKDAA
jgi:hypothetical protein